MWVFVNCCKSDKLQKNLLLLIDPDHLVGESQSFGGNILIKITMILLIISLNIFLGLHLRMSEIEKFEPV